MDETRLNEILEETIRDFVINPFPSSLANSTTTTTNLTRPFQLQTDLSLNIPTHTRNFVPSSPSTTAHNANPLHNAPPLPIPNSEPNANSLPTVISEAESLQRQRFFELMDDFCTRWSRYTHDYHENIRMYNQNAAQMSRLHQTLLRSIHVLHPSRSDSSIFQVQPTEIQPHITTSTTTNTHVDTNNGEHALINFPIHARDFLRNRWNNSNLDLHGFSIPLQMAAPTETPQFPTIMQVLNATERFTFTSDTTRRINDVRCPISLEEYVLGEELCEIRHCRHVFKWSSLQNWFSRNSHCPVCRYDIRTFPTEVTDNTDDPL